MVDKYMYIYISIYLYIIHIIITHMIRLSIFARSLDSWAMRGASSARGGGELTQRMFAGASLRVKWGIHRMKSSNLLWDVHIIELDDGQTILSIFDGKKYMVSGEDFPSDQSIDHRKRWET